MIQKKLTYLLIGVCLTAISQTSSAAPVQKKRINVLFLFSDDQRPDTIAALGNKHITTPNLDQLVKSGMVFHRAYCMGSMQGAVCLPSRTMVLTGLTLFRINKTKDTPIFPIAMKNAGYITFRTGKRGNTPAFATKEFHTNKNVPRSPVCSQTHADDAIKFLKSLNGKQPFFLYVAFGHPHDPRRAPEEYMKKYSPGSVPLPPNYLPVHPFDNGEMAIRDERLAPWPRTKDEIKKHLAEYYATIEHMDMQIGRIFQQLRDIGEYDNTIIIFSSDHGLAIGSHGLMGKQNIYDHSMRVPFIISGPGIPKGQSTNAFTYLLDVFPTVCDLCGVPIPKNVEGKSLAPVIRGKSKGVRDSVFTAYKVQRGIRTDDWALIRYTHINKTQLFDMKNDPHQTKNLADDAKYEKQVAMLMTKLQQWQKKLGDKQSLTSAKPQNSEFVPPKGKPKKKKKGKNKRALQISTSPRLRVSAPLSAQPDPQVAMITPDGESSKYWPRWRGPSRQGVADPGAYPDAWSNTKNVLWKVDLPGNGNSSPIIWKDRIFMTTSYDKGEKRAIICLERDGGKLLWQAYSPKAVVEKTQRKNGFASGTPTTDGERVYAYFGNFGLLCVDMNGKQVWHQNFAPMNALHGTACSPLLYKDRVIVFQDERNDHSFVAAFNKYTGKEIWRTPRKEKVGWGTPIAIRVDGKDQIIVSSSKRVYAYNPDDGKVIWTVGGNQYEVTPTPVVGHGMVFCCSGRVGPTLAIRPTGTGDITKSHMVWSVPKGSPFIPSPILVGDYLYMVNDIVSVAMCYEAKTGKLMWKERLGEPTKHGFSASPVAVNGKIFFTTDIGDTYVLKAGPKFELLHVNHLKEKTLASPALVDGRWYFRTESQLLCIGK